jgi:hypothetical protein
MLVLHFVPCVSNHMVVVNNKMLSDEIFSLISLKDTSSQNSFLLKDLTLDWNRIDSLFQNTGVHLLIIG